MRNDFAGSTIAVATVTMLSFAPFAAAGQRNAGSGRFYAPPRTPDGQPDIRGHWSERSVTSFDLEKGKMDPRHVAIVGTGDEDNLKSPIVDPPNQVIPYQPWALAKRNAVRENLGNPKPDQVDPQTHCVLGGVRLMYQGSYQILQIPGAVVFLHEFTHGYRVVTLDEESHIGQDIKLYMGDSRGHWEGDTLVVDSTNFNDKNWCDIVGGFHSDALHVIERMTIVDANTINYEATIEDPVVFTKPWKIRYPIIRLKGTTGPDRGYELMEEACHEGERDSRSMIR